MNKPARRSSCESESGQTKIAVYTPRQLHITGQGIEKLQLYYILGK